MEDDPKKIASALSKIYPQIECVLFDEGGAVGVMRRFLECIEVLPGHENGIIRITKVAAGEATAGNEVRLVVLSTLHAGNSIVLTKESAVAIDRLKYDDAKKAEIMCARSPARPGPVVFTLDYERVRDRERERVQVPVNVQYLQHNLPCNEFQVANDFLRSLGQRITGGDGPSPGMTSDEWVAGLTSYIMEVEEGHRIETARVHNRFYEKKEDRARGLTERAHAQFKLDGGLCATVAEDRQNQVFYKWGLSEFVQPGRVFFTSSTDHDEWKRGAAAGVADSEVSSVAFNLVFGVEFRTRVDFGGDTYECCYTRSFYVNMNKFRSVWGAGRSLMFLCTDLLKLLSGKQLYQYLVKLSTPTKSDEFEELISQELNHLRPRYSKPEYKDLFDLLNESLGFRHHFMTNFKKVDPKILFIDAGCGELQVLTPDLHGGGGGGCGGCEYSVSPMRLVSANDDAVQIIDSDGTLTVRITGLGPRELVSMLDPIHPISPTADSFGSDDSRYGSSDDEGGGGSGAGWGGRKKRKYTRNKRRVSVKRIRSIKQRLCSHRRRRNGVRRRNTIKKLK